MRLLMRWLLAPFVTLTLIVSGAVVANAGPDGSLCDSNTQRVHIPSNFPIDACFDGSTLFIRNSLGFPVVANVTGDSVGQASRTASASGSMPSLVLSVLGPQTPNMLPPGYEMKVPIGRSSAKVQLSTTQDLTRGYGYLSLVWKYAPGLDDVRTVVDLVAELSQDGDQYRSCMASHNTWGDIGCKALFVRNVAFAVGRAGVGAIAKGVTAALMNLLDVASWTNQMVDDVQQAHSGTPDFTIGAAPKPKQTTPPPSNNPPPNTNSQSQQPSGQSTQAAPQGGDQSQQQAPPGPTSKTVTVWNRTLSGPTAMTNDSIPAYLSTQEVSFCRLKGCKLDGTEMLTGDTMTALCYDPNGSYMTNSNLNDPSDDHNPNRIDSTMWYKGVKNGQTGWISEIYIEPQDRGGAGLPQC